MVIQVPRGYPVLIVKMSNVEKKAIIKSWSVVYTFDYDHMIYWTDRLIRLLCTMSSNYVILGLSSVLAGIFLFVKRSSYTEFITKKATEKKKFKRPFFIKMMERCFGLGDDSLKRWTFRYCLVVAENQFPAPIRNIRYIDFFEFSISFRPEWKDS